MARKNLLKGFKKPKGITFEHISTNPNYGKFTAYPFEPGFGTTVGNTLRRVLLSSIQGYAVSSVRITSYDDNGIPHVISSEFEAIPHVSEDTLEIINSLKQIRLRLPEDSEQETIMYEFKGPGVVKSDDFAKEGQLEIMTKDKLVFTMMEGAHLDVEIQVDLGRMTMISLSSKSGQTEQLLRKMLWAKLQKLQKNTLQSLSTSMTKTLSEMMTAMKAMRALQDCSRHLLKNLSFLFARQIV